MIGIIDYDAGNIKSVEKALAYIGEETIVSRDPEMLLKADKAILPGVGSFGQAMENLHRYNLVPVIKDMVKNNTPFLGICLGHQCIGEAFGGVVSYAKELFHGKQSEITHDGQGIFKGIDSPVKVARYHSLAVQKESLPECLVVTAETEDGEIMAVRHKKYPVYGLQFHPESIYTEHGKRMIENFLGRTA